MTPPANVDRAAATTLQLVLGTVPADFDPVRHLPLSPACFIGVEHVYPDWESLPFCDPFPTPADLADAARDTMDLFEYLLSGLAAELNRRHGRSFSRGFWCIVLLPWLYRLIETAWARWCLVARLAAAHRGKTVEAELLVGEADWHFTSFSDFLFRGPAAAAYDMWLSSQVIAAQRPPGWRRTERHFTPSQEGRPPIVAEGRHGSPLRRLARRLWPLPRFDNVPDVDWPTKLMFSALLSLAPARRRAVTAEAPCPATPPRAFPEDFLALVNRLMALTAPASIGSAFATHERSARAGRYRPGRVTVGAVTWVAERDIFAAALAEEAGEKVVSSQYGCNYGTTLAFDFTARLQYGRHAFVTWGWMRHGDYPGRFIPLPSPQLSAAIDAHAERQARMIFVSTYCHLRLVRAVSLPQPGGYVRYRGRKGDFVRALSGPARSALHYRPYLHGDGDLEDTGYMRRLLPGLPLVEGPLTPHLLGCRMMVIDHPGTTLYAALVAGVPTVGWWDFADWPLSPTAEPAFALLERARIIHRDPAAAAAHINAVWDNVDAWWHSDAVESARRAFCANYALAARGWRWQWAKALFALSARS